ncbi:MAG: hypothetical protein ACKOE2_12715, partial [Actinomycetales bacterium]
RPDALLYPTANFGPNGLDFEHLHLLAETGLMKVSLCVGWGGRPAGQHLTDPLPGRRVVQARGRPRMAAASSQVATGTPRRAQSAAASATNSTLVG